MIENLPRRIEIASRLYLRNGDTYEDTMRQEDASTSPPEVATLHHSGESGMPRILLRYLRPLRLYRVAGTSREPHWEARTHSKKVILWRSYKDSMFSLIRARRYRDQSRDRITDAIAWKIHTDKNYSIESCLKIAHAIYQDWYRSNGRISSKHLHPSPGRIELMGIDPAGPRPSTTGIRTFIIDDLEGDKEKSMDTSKLEPYPDTGKFGQVYMINRYIQYKDIKRRIVLAGRVEERWFSNLPLLKIAFAMCRPLDENGDEFDLELGQKIAKKRLDKRPLASITVNDLGSMSRRTIRAVMEDYADDMEQDLGKYVAFAGEVEDDEQS